MKEKIIDQFYLIQFYIEKYFLIFKYFLIRNYYKVFKSKEIIKFIFSNKLNLGEEYITSSKMNMKYLSKGIMLMLK